MSDLTLISIPFHGKPLVTFQHEGEPHVAMKPIVEGMGLQWEAQHKRISRSPILASTMSIMDIVAEDGKRREMVALPLKMLNGWLFGIDVDRVKPELRETILAYQRECYDVLYRYWHEGKAERPAAQDRATAFIQKKVDLALAYDKAPTPFARQSVFEAMTRLHEDHGESMSPELLRLHHESLWSEHPIVVRFWEAFETLAQLGDALDHSSDPDLIGINLKHFLEAAKRHGVELAPQATLKTVLKKSMERKYLYQATLRSNVYDDNRVVWCWVFRLNGGEV